MLLRYILPGYSYFITITCSRTDLFDSKFDSNIGFNWLKPLVDTVLHNSGISRQSKPNSFITIRLYFLDATPNNISLFAIISNIFIQSAYKSILIYLAYSSYANYFNN